jgi:putative membrane protein
MQPCVPQAVFKATMEATMTGTPKPGDKSETVSAVRDTVGGWAAKALALVTSDKQSFANLVAMSDLYEIQASELALKRSRRNDVKGFAQEMIRDHKKTSEELKSMLGSMNEATTLPTKLDTLFQVLIDDLRGAANDDFDKRYVAQQQDVHDVAITLVKHYRDQGDTSALRELSKLALPVLEHHRDMADRMAQAA